MTEEPGNNWLTQFPELQALQDRAWQEALAHTEVVMLVKALSWF
jgi:hypothetical protein